MSAYHGRPGPNFSQFINDLNTPTQPYNQDFLSADDLNLDQELALFTNTDFTDFDSLGPLPDSGLAFDFPDGSKTPHHDIKYEDLLGGPTAPSMSAQSSSNHFLAHSPTSIPALPSEPSHSQPVDCSAQLDQSPTSQESSQASGAKRKASAISNASSQQLPSRLAAEEDKRRRNTAASARFRVKKKQREQALERTVKEVNDKNTALEVKINQLEMENKWLKNLVTEKNGKQSKEEIAEAYKQFRRDSEERDTGKGDATQRRMISQG